MKSKVYKILITIFLLLLLFLEIITVKSIMNNKYNENVYWLKGDYYIKKINNKNYIFSSKLPTENIISIMEKDNVIMLHCENNKYYILDIERNEINGPLGKNEFYKEAIKYLDIEDIPLLNAGS